MTDTGKLILRLALGILILLHGISKLMHGIDPILGMVEGAGLPRAFGYLVYVGEVVAPIFVIVGFLTRPAAAVIAINMLVAVFLAHQAMLFQLSKQGGWALELQGMFLFTAIAIAMLGAGRFGVARPSRWN